MARFKPETLTEDKSASKILNPFEPAEESNLQTLNRTYKSSLFEQIFNSKSEALSLYNAINGTDYTDETKLNITTLGGILFMGYKNDVSFLIDSMLNSYSATILMRPASMSTLPQD